MDLQDVEKYLHKNENVLMKLRQSYLSSISPDTVVLTDKRVIIIHNSFWGLYLHYNIATPTRVSTVLLDNIMGTTMTTGKILSTVYVRIRGSDTSDVSEDTGWHMAGLRTRYATRLANTIVELLESKGSKIGEVDIATARSMVENGGSEIVWLGVEQPDYVAYMLKLDRSKVVRVNPADISSMSPEGLKYFEGKILACYSGEVSSEFVALLKNEYGVKSYMLKGGLLGAIKYGMREKDNNVSGKE